MQVYSDTQEGHRELRLDSRCVREGALPLRSEAKAGIGPHERLRKCVEAARNLLIEAELAAGGEN
jgi:hypothetical protein